MPRRLLLALLLLVAAPLVLLGWLSARSVEDSRQRATERLAALLSTRLIDADREVGELFDRYADQLQAELAETSNIYAALKRLRRENPIVRQGIYVDSDGVQIFPTAADMNGSDEAEVAAGLPGLIDARPLPSRLPDASDARGSDVSRRPSLPGMIRPVVFEVAAAKAAGSAGKAATKSAGRSQTPPPTLVAWQQWYLGDGAQIVFWKQLPDRSTVGILLDRSRWMADIISLLPDQPPAATQPPSQRSRPASANADATPLFQVSLVDESKRLIYRWGSTDEPNRPPLATRNVTRPLTSWQFRLHTDGDLLPDLNPWPMYLSLGGIGLVLLSIGAYVLTSVQRQMRLAQSRVSFAGQVSHELRTPLTNIRLFTELAESDLANLQEGPAKSSLVKRLQVIDHESKRLQRLVTGVLEMIRPTGKQSGVRTRPTDVCELISGIIEQFRPSFASAEISLESRCECDHPIAIDPDVVEMVLVNLLSNVEKYVPQGGGCWLQTETVADQATGRPQLRVLVDDDGPGIGATDRHRVFAAFQRLDDSISAPSGTGIGLTIARRAARRHGGELALLSKSKHGGATFELILPIQTASNPAPK
ncbi:HAMP domain-containing histidine kinase [Roseiconus nitratireducens]|uniref:histidine kinase n=1 Tax=Roseiconus nitratireducens TaxID=2605748 RepID=A0A5M6DCF2_9BACT|nr:HAMP domain-containing sensor histidine kinase [Roseiconus nitratireducens]KAA5545238.1 HAMP domain-containing histidine kinase [Roseiconus nitratireducens]